jgi:hypothetical protein
VESVGDGAENADWFADKFLAITFASVEQVCCDYVALGGNHRRTELIGYLKDEGGWSRYEHTIAAPALNERCAELDLGHLVAADPP